MKFIITVDTEADNQWHKPAVHTVQNIKYLPRFQALCEKYGFLPSYLVTYEVANSPEAISILKPWQDKNLAEIGAHLHPWTTPPLDKDQELGHKIHRFPSELPETELKAKLVNLTDIIEKNFQKRPTSFRAGRWGVDFRVIEELQNLGYTIDCSVTPKVSWQKIHGPDFRFSRFQPYLWPESKILEAPMTILFTGLFKKENFIFAKLFLKLPDGFIKKIINRLFFRQKWFRIFKNSNLDDFKRLYKSAIQNNLPYLQFMIHSSELMPGGSIYNKDEQSIETLYQKLEDLFKYLKNQNIQGITLSDFVKNYDQTKN